MAIGAAAGVSRNARSISTPLRSRPRAQGRRSTRSLRARAHTAQLRAVVDARSARRRKGQLAPPRDSRPTPAGANRAIGIADLAPLSRGRGAAGVELPRPHRSSKRPLPRQPRPHRRGGREAEASARHANSAVNPGAPASASSWRSPERTRAKTLRGSALMMNRPRRSRHRPDPARPLQPLEVAEGGQTRFAPSTINASTSPRQRSARG
jgi:hypothetical protein